METLGRKTFNNGYNLKTEVENILKKNGIGYKRIVHKVEDPYEKRRYKPEYVGQCCWIYQNDRSEILRNIKLPGILVKQSDFVDAPENALEDYLISVLD